MNLEAIPEIYHEKIQLWGETFTAEFIVTLFQDDGEILLRSVQQLAHDAIALILTNDEEDKFLAAKCFCEILGHVISVTLTAA